MGQGGAYHGRERIATFRKMQGIICDTHPSVKDEAPAAYKDLTEVMKHQESLTEIVYRLLPIINVKGFETKLPKKYKNAKNRRTRNRTAP